MPQEINYVVIFLVVVTALIVLMIAFVIAMLYIYTKKQNSFHNTINQVKLDHAKTLMATQLEIQEQTFQNISREIHDNINLSLTLCKLNLNTLDFTKPDELTKKVTSSIDLLGKAISELGDISKSLNSDIILHQGLIKAVEREINRVNQTGVIKIEWRLLGEPIFMESQQELIIFRIVQEALNNIIKHSNAKNAYLELNYFQAKLQIRIADNGKGFEMSKITEDGNAGFKNMQARIKMLNGSMMVKALPGSPTTLLFTIPFN